MTNLAQDELSGFREEVRAWLAENCPPGARGIPQSADNSFWGGRNAVHQNEDRKLWFERMAQRGWTVPTWPQRYGGGGLDSSQARILAEEMRRIDAVNPLQSLGIMMLGARLFGTRRRIRPRQPANPRRGQG